MENNVENKKRAAILVMQNNEKKQLGNIYKNRKKLFYSIFSIFCCDKHIVWCTFV